MVWLSALWGSLFFFYQFLQMNLLNSVSHYLMEAHQWSLTELSFISTSYFLAAGLWSIPAGWIIDRYNVRHIVLLGMSCSVLVSIGLALVENAWLFGLLRFMQGTVHAFCFISSIILAARWLKPNQMALATGLIVTLGMLGGTLAQGPFAWLHQTYGWQTTLFIDALFGASILIVLYFYLQDSPSTKNRVKSLPPTANRLTTCIQALRNRQNWLAGLYTSLLNLPIMVLGAIWGNHYLQQTHAIYPVTAGNIISMIFIGTMFGSPLMGWLSDYVKQRCLIMKIMALLSILCMAAIIYVPTPSIALLMGLFLLLGIFTSAQIISYPLITESNPSQITASALSIASVVIMLTPVIFQPLIGWLMETIALQKAILTLDYAFLVALGLVFFLKETYCKPYQETIKLKSRRLPASASIN